MKISDSWLYQRIMLCAVVISLSFTSAAQEDYADTTETGSKSYIDVNFESLLDSISALELETGEEINRFLEEAVPGRLYMRHDYAALMDSLDWLVGELFDCGTDVVNFDGHDYTTVEIGGQCWFAENLRSTNYRDGTTITTGLSNTDWENATTGAVAVYNDDETTNLETYGRMYNWHAVDDARGLCPSGWHVPTDGNWQDMEVALGMLDTDTDQTGWRGEVQNVGGKLKSITGWNGTNEGATNEIGFYGLPGGLRSDDGEFGNQAYGAYFWSSSPEDSDVWYRSLAHSEASVGRGSVNSLYGFSVRCIQTVQGCVDSGACNYDATAHVDDGSCIAATLWYVDADGDGLGDSGTSQSACDQPTGFVADSSDSCDDLTANNYDDTGNAACYYCGTETVTFDGHAYETVLIGGQCWFSENLRTTTYRNGTPIPSALDDATWGSTTSGASTIYDEGGANEATNLSTYGRLYNWYAVDNHNTNVGQELCPTDWHVPTDAEWTTLTDELGGESVAGGKLKEAGMAHWNSPNTGATNESGFVGLPGGSRANYGAFNTQGYSASFWSSSASGSNAWSRLLHYINGSVYRSSISTPRFGFAVRCVRD